MIRHYNGTKIPQVSADRPGPGWMVIKRYKREKQATDGIVVSLPLAGAYRRSSLISLLAGCPGRDRRRRRCSSPSPCVISRILVFAQSGGACARRQQDRGRRHWPIRCKGRKKGFSTASGTLLIVLAAHTAWRVGPWQAAGFLGATATGAGLGPSPLRVTSEKNSVRVYVFRFALKIRHCSTQPTLRTCANKQHSQRLQLNFPTG